MKEKLKLTPLEKSWILYDIGNSAFILMVSTLIPIYFNSLASSAGVNEDLYLSYWGYAGSIATVLAAPAEIPTSTPSALPTRFPSANASSFATVMISS